MGKQLGVACLVAVLHGNYDVFSRSHQIHRATHAFHHAAGNFPIGDVAVLAYFHCSQNGEVNFLRAYHAKAHRRIKHRTARKHRDGLLSGVDQIRIFIALKWKWAHAEQAILRL